MGYAGDLTPSEAYDLMGSDAAAVLVDVRTSAEWSYVGGPVLDEPVREVARIEWTRFPGGTPNPDFIADLSAAAPDPDAPVVFICRSGVRSVAAARAATAAGWRRAFNVSDGFEGPPDVDGPRGTTTGWKAVGLPWRQT